MRVAIKVEQLSKSYLIKHNGESYSSLRDTITKNVQNVFLRVKKTEKPNILEKKDKKEEFWALRDVNFEVQQGERIGIVGRNGAGKSTLLKVLSRITEPSMGRISTKGRIASLLEVGTGFHPELTGRENIYLNGAILGMHRSEIKRKFDEIVDFSGVERFLDTPVKRYSSGMYVRLAFAVAAHLESEILIVDEVLAVGDMEFQKKCLGKMHDIAKGQGKTVLFVSHNMTAVQSLCNRGILLSEGKIIFTGDKNEVINKYISLSTGKHSIEELSFKDGDIEFHGFNIFEKTILEKLPPSKLRTGEKIVIEFRIKNNSSFSRRGKFNIEIKNEYGTNITCFGNEFNNKILELSSNSQTKITIENEGINFIPGQYIINFYYEDALNTVYKTDILSFEILHSDILGTGLLPSSISHGSVISKPQIIYSKVK